jgi:P-type Cu+ transporter
MSERTRKTTLPVTGMTCASCAAAIEQGLAGLPGLSRVNVNVASEDCIDRIRSAVRSTSRP